MEPTEADFKRGAVEFGEIWGNLDAPIWICGIEPGGEGIPDLRAQAKYSYQHGDEAVPCWNRMFRDDNLRQAETETDRTRRRRARYVNWPFCRNSAKLVMAIVTMDMEGQWREYYRPDAASARDDWCYGGPEGAVLGLNLYPLNFTNTDEGRWTSDHIRTTGFQSMVEYREWCRSKRFGRLRSLAQAYAPSAVVCAGNGWHDDFKDAFGVPNGPKALVESMTLPDLGRRCELWHTGLVGTLLFVVPHLSRAGRPRPLWTNADITTAGAWIRRRMGVSLDALAKFWPPPT